MVTYERKLSDKEQDKKRIIFMKKYGIKNVEYSTSYSCFKYVPKSFKECWNFPHEILDRNNIEIKSSYVLNLLLEIAFFVRFIGIEKEPLLFKRELENNRTLFFNEKEKELYIKYYPFSQKERLVKRKLVKYSKKEFIEEIYLEIEKYIKGRYHTSLYKKGTSILEKDKFDKPINCVVNRFLEGDNSISFKYTKDKNRLIKIFDE